MSLIAVAEIGGRPRGVPERAGAEHYAVGRLRGGQRTAEKSLRSLAGVQLRHNDRTMPGYSATPQMRKLGLKPGHRVALVADEGWVLTDPPHVEYVDDGAADVVVAFVRTASELDGVGAMGQRIFPDGALWIAWPRKAAGHVSDVTENAIRDAALPLGLVDVKVAAIDDDWSGLKLVWRREKRS